MNASRGGLWCFACVRQSFKPVSPSVYHARFLLARRSSSASNSPDSTPSTRSTSLHATRQTLNEARTQLDALVRQMQARARERGKQYWAAAAARRIELEQKLRDVGGSINQATGYEQIDRLRLDVIRRERTLLTSREEASLAKKAYSAAVATRADSQKEVNDLLQRKSSWNSADVLRFTTLIQQDHENERAEAKAKVEMDVSEDRVEKNFTDLMQSILERYHEEQVWSDKIRSLSTYGSLGITALNMFLFIVTILLVEPWKRRRLVEGVESRTNTAEGQQATMSALTSLQSLLTDAQAKLDTLASINTSAQERSAALDPAAEESEVEAEPTLEPLPTALLPDTSLGREQDSISVQRQREKDALTYGGIGIMAGMICTLLVSAVGR